MAGLHGMDWLVDGPAADRLVGYHPDITSNERALLKPHRDLRDGFTGVLPHPPVELVFLLRLDLPPRGRAPCLLYTSPSPRDQRGSRMPSSA